MKRIALATSAKLPTLNDDDRLLIPALAELGLGAVPAVWDSPDVCWEEFQGVLVRSCWDYHHRLEELLRAGDVMVQPFIDEVRDPGEWSIIFLGGRFSHAVRKRPAAADYRVQWEFGGTAAPMAPPARLVADAAAVMAALPGHPLYARVDGVERDGRLMLMELELIEPHLFLGWDADA